MWVHMVCVNQDNVTVTFQPPKEYPMVRWVKEHSFAISGEKGIESSSPGLSLLVGKVLRFWIKNYQLFGTIIDLKVK